MLRQKYVAGTHCHRHVVINMYTVHNSYSSDRLHPDNKQQ